MGWTDRHCRVFHRRGTCHVPLYIEMVTAAVTLHGDRLRLLDFDPVEQPMALQLGGTVGCPWDRVHEDRFGACLMAEPALVASSVAALRVSVKVKCWLHNLAECALWRPWHGGVFAAHAAELHSCSTRHGGQHKFRFYKLMESCKLCEEMRVRW
jgi:hypothetical protein